MTSSSFETTGATWYVAATGSDLNSCTTEIRNLPRRLTRAINKAVSDDTIKIATGTYTGTGTEAVLANKNLTFSGGWDTDFVIQDGYSTIDGQNERMGVVLEGGANAIIERFKVQNGNASYPWATGAIHITNGTLTCNYCIIGDNLNNYSIYNDANNTLTLNDQHDHKQQRNRNW